jgi:hypothetical protein
MGPKDRPYGPYEVRRVVAPREKPDAPRVQGIGVYDPSDVPLAEEPSHVPSHRISRLPHRSVKDEELHEEAPVHRLALSLLLAPVLKDVDGGQAGGGT